MPSLTVDIWSDVVCPWCYIGKRRFEQALERFAHRADVVVHWRAFELDPGAVSAPAGTAVAPNDHAERLAAKYGTDVPGAQGMLDSMTATAAAEGLDLRFDRAVRANTTAAHEVIHLGSLRGVQDAVKERLLRAYFTEGEAVGDHDVLVRLATDAGLDADEVRAALDEGRYTAVVRTEEAEAAAIGVQGVPFFVVDRRYGVSGAQSPEVLLGVLERAWAESASLVTVGAPAPDADACGPEGCAV